MQRPLDSLAGLDTVLWDTLYGTHGPATKIPEYVRALRNPDPIVHDDALARLSDVVYHQGTRWQVSAHVVPFLASVIDDPATPRRAALAELLHAIAVGDRMDGDPSFLPDPIVAARPTGEQFDAVIRLIYHPDDDTSDLPTDLVDRVARLWEADAFAAAARHTTAYVRWLADPDQHLASEAAALLAWFGPTNDITTALLAVPATEGEARASANLALAHPLHAEATINHRLRALLADEHTAVVITAAVALAYRLGDTLPDRAFDVLLQAWDTDHLPDTPRGWKRAMRGFVALALQRLGLG